MIDVLPTPDGGYVSWGRESAIRYWDSEGTATLGAVSGAHKHRIDGVFPTPDGGCVSWGGNDEIRFWNKEGGTAREGILYPHKGEIHCVLLISGGIYVSMGQDGAIRFWGKTNRSLGTLVPPRGADGIKIIGNRLLVFGRGFWVYPLTDGLPWKENRDCNEV